MRSNLSVLFVLLFATPLYCVCQTKPHFSTRDSVQIINIYNEWLTAYQNKDIDKVMSVFDARVVGAAYASHELGYTELKKGYQNEFIHDNGNVWSLRSVDEVKGSETLAVVRTTWVLHPKEDKQKILLTNKAIDVFEKNNGSWKITRWFTHVANK
jgi:ketosteroid isomerase-like protein